jgi:hypothetical protein
MRAASLVACGDGGAPPCGAQAEAAVATNASAVILRSSFMAFSCVKDRL